MTDAYVQPELFNHFLNDHKQEKSNVKMVFFGNSITFHGPAHNIGWHSSHGMAANSEQNDYVHLVMQKLNLSKEEVIIENFAEIEQKDITISENFEKIKKIITLHAPIIIFQLGDNISNDEQLNYFWNNIHFIQPLLKCKQIYFLSTWWESEVKDSIVKNLCRKFDWHHIYIGDIFTSENNLDRKIQSYDHPGVETHPKDWGMHQIADRILGSLDLTLLC